jgi:hypothetical protein
MTKQTVSTAVVALAVLAPASVLACPVCGLVGTGDNDSAYRWMSALLSVLPLGMIAGMAFWLARRVSQHVAAPTPSAAAAKPLK